MSTVNSILLPALVLSSVHFGILDTGQYHYNELWAQDGDIWLGLYEVEGGFHLQETELVITRVVDEIIDRDGEVTGKSVETTGDTDPVCLIWASAPVFAEGELVTGCSGTPELLPDTTIHLSAPGMDDAWITASSKGIFMTDGTYQQRLTLMPSEEERRWSESVRVVWAGDLDGDGRFDVILDIIPHYAIYRGLALFLSSVAGPDHPVSRVARFIAISC